MFILEEPFVSDFLCESVRSSGAQVLATPMAERRLPGHPLVEEGDFAAAYRSADHPRLYANSENGLGWITEHLRDTALPEAVAVMKDKVRFRQLMHSLQPEYRFQELRVRDLDAARVPSLPMPFVAKPAVGFFSLAVHVVSCPEDWPGVVASIREEADSLAGLYPPSVLGLDRLVLEEVIEGDEFAIDAYYDSDGEAVLLNVLEHPFVSGGDVTDRVYFTSTEVIDRWKLRFTSFLADFGQRAGLSDFPVHLEVRVGPDGMIRPIEANPLRFGGWCAADIAHHAWGIDPYRAYLEDRRPDWDRILEGRHGRRWALVVAAVPRGLDRRRVRHIDYDALLARFSCPLELRRIEDPRHSVFAFLFVDVADERRHEIDAILQADLREVLTLD